MSSTQIPYNSYNQEFLPIEKTNISSKENKNISSIESKIIEQKKFLFNLLINQSKFINPLADKDSNDLSVKTIGQIAELERMDLQYQSIREGNEYQKMAFKSNLINKEVIVPSDEFYFDKNGNGTITCAIDINFSDNDKFNIAIYDKSGEFLTNQEISRKNIKNNKNNIYDIEFKLDDENIKKILNSNADIEDLRCTVFVKNHNDFSEKSIKTYGHQTITSVFTEDDYFTTNKKKKYNLNEIKGFIGGINNIKYENIKYNDNNTNKLIERSVNELLNNDDLYNISNENYINNIKNQIVQKTIDIAV
ncbi:hypothetical protein [Lyticum sinuosum]|uniref:Flagellar basal body rod modification protein n=1 Tax=Lyticum sinuosum TaxID=1332059 RepID=A0AAE4VM98_9RICK|nr:hypothetical protein [Lyticum sinuosum]MDZ5761561.1 flagellar basal body rod modification protein [Lyticum sinuosum]